jgi:hypothetical protein
MRDVQRSAWQFCRGSDWACGPFGWSSGEFGGPYGPPKILDYGGSASCGAGCHRAVAATEYRHQVRQYPRSQFSIAW